MAEFVDDLPLDGEVIVNWRDLDPERGIYRGYRAGNTRRCAVELSSNPRGCCWIDRTIITNVENTG